MDSEDVSRETSSLSICGEILHPMRGNYFSLARGVRDVHFRPSSFYKF
jgi:hypothetical protein